MLAKPYANDITDYQLAQGFSLQRAPSEAFVKHWAVYRQINEDFSQSLQDQTLDLAGIPYGFWIQRHEQKIGGVILLPNKIGDFFLIPPYNDAVTALQCIMPLLHHWSDSDKDIQAQGITTDYAQAFQELGFGLQESRRWMIRPTTSQATQWPAKFELKALKPADANRISGLLYESFSGGVGLHGRKTLPAHLRSVQGFFENYEAESPTGQASIQIVDRENERLAGVCLVIMHKGLPCIQFVAVAPYYRRQGLGSNMLYRALSILEAEANWLKLSVTTGNPAEKLYSNLGFCNGETVHTLVIPAAHQ